MHLFLYSSYIEEHLRLNYKKQYPVYDTLQKSKI